MPQHGEEFLAMRNNTRHKQLWRHWATNTKSYDPFEELLPLSDEPITIKSEILAGRTPEEVRALAKNIVLRKV